VQSLAQRVALLQSGWRCCTSAVLVVVAAAALATPSVEQHTGGHGCTLLVVGVGPKRRTNLKVEKLDRFCSTTPCDYAPSMMPLQEFPQLSDSGVELLNRLLTFDPEKRITARQALRHPYFTGARRSSLIGCMLAEEVGLAACICLCAAQNTDACSSACALLRCPMLRCRASAAAAARVHAHLPLSPRCHQRRQRTGGAASPAAGDGGGSRAGGKAKVGQANKRGCTFWTCHVPLVVGISDIQDLVSLCDCPALCRCCLQTALQQPPRFVNRLFLLQIPDGRAGPVWGRLWGRSGSAAARGAASA
jgi:hypothetical protein